MSVWIAQCLCPDRHTIMAAAGEATDQADATEHIRDPLARAVGAAVETSAINPWCGICHAKFETWDVELGRTQFATMAEASPSLKRLGDEQAAVRALFGDMKRSD